MDYEEKNKKFRDIDKSMQKDLKPIFDRLIEKSERNMDSKSPTSWDEYVPPCGITNRNEPMTEEQIRDADNLVDIAITTIMENPRDFPLIEGQVPDFVQADHALFVKFLKSYLLIPLLDQELAATSR